MTPDSSLSFDEIDLQYHAIVALSRSIGGFPVTVHRWRTLSTSVRLTDFSQLSRDTYVFQVYSVQKNPLGRVVGMSLDSSSSFRFDQSRLRAVRLPPSIILEAL